MLRTVIIISATSGLVIFSKDFVDAVQQVMMRLARDRARVSLTARRSRD